jgi:hypothetical protein
VADNGAREMGIASVHEIPRVREQAMAMATTIVMVTAMATTIVMVTAMATESA